MFDAHVLQLIDSVLLSVLSRQYQHFPMTAESRLFCLRYARAKLYGSSEPFIPPSMLSQLPGFCFLSIYEKEYLIQCVSGRGENILTAIDDAVAKSNLFESTMRLSFCFLFDEKIVKQDEIVLGLDAIGLKQNSAIAFFKNSVPIHHQFNLTQALEKLSEKAGLSKQAYLDPTTLLFAYKTIEFIEDESLGLCDWYRGNPLVIYSDLNKDYLEKAQSHAIQFLKNALISNDSVHYYYFFRQKKMMSEESISAITRIFAGIYEMIMTTGDVDSYRMLVSEMMGVYFSDEGKIGFLQVKDKTHLSLNSFALLVLLSYEDDFMGDKKNAMLKWIESQLSDDKTHFLLKEPEALFYSAQALLVFLKVFEKTQDQKYLDYCISVFPYYQNLFEITDKKILMQTWFSKAYAKVFLITKEKKYADFIFALNDIVLPIQIQPGFNEVDLIGGFSRDGNSRTNACILEGLCEALRIATVLTLKTRMICYERAIVLGLRALLQLHYTPENCNDINVMGGFKTSLFELDVRIDNVQHALAVVHFVLKNRLFH